MQRRPPPRCPVLQAQHRKPVQCTPTPRTAHAVWALGGQPEPPAEARAFRSISVAVAPCPVGCGRFPEDVTCHHVHEQHALPCPCAVTSHGLQPVRLHRTGRESSRRLLNDLEGFAASPRPKRVTGEAGSVCALGGRRVRGPVRFRDSCVCPEARGLRLRFRFPAAACFAVTADIQHESVTCRLPASLGRAV